MKIAIYSGSFNPIHNGHLAVASAALSCGIDEVWLVVSPQNPLKREGDLLPEQDRLTMVELAVTNYPGLKACDCEFHLPRPSFTIDTLNFLRNQYPENQFVLLIGLDNLALFHRWKKHNQILEQYGLLVYPRGNKQLSHIDIHPRIQLIDAPLLPNSSTDIREKIEKNESIDGLAPDTVIEYLCKLSGLR